jgi:hypothetical protein
MHPFPYSLFAAITSAVKQLAFPDHHAADRMKLPASDSVRIYATPNAIRDRVNHAPIPLMVSLGTPACTARRTSRSVRHLHRTLASTS